jgi:hypothetical protein
VSLRAFVRSRAAAVARWIEPRRVAQREGGDSGRPGRLRARTEILLVLFALSVFACLIVPLSYGDKTVYVLQGRDLDATEGCLLTACGIDKLLSDPLSFYDTAILYPDRNQLRSTEPFLGYAILGLPLRVFFHLRDVDLFEVLRWAVVFTSLTYAYFLHKALGIGGTLSAAGALVCLSQPGFLDEIERLQVLCIPLILPVLFHGLIVWQSDRRRPVHSAGLFFFAALYPLCGAVNATISLMAGLFVLPLLVKMLADLRRRKRLASVLVPIALAVVVDALALAPWLLDRSDLKPYVTDGFLLIKHWNPTNVALRVRHIPQFLVTRVGWPLTVALIMLSIVVTQRRAGTGGRGEASDPGSYPAPENQLLMLLVPASAMLVAASYGFNRYDVPWLGLLFDIACAMTLLLYWRGQAVLSATTDEFGVRQSVVMLSAGLAVFLCFMSFGPVYASNTHPLATSLMRVLLAVLPPLKSIREYDRIWMFGMLFLSVYVTVRLGIALRGRGAVTRLGAAAIVTVTMIASLNSRRLVASAEIEAPRDFVALTLRSPGRGGIYVHPMMKWNSSSGVLMIAIARAVGRRIVNGSLGICPPWFVYATSVLHRFPDPEALWLLRKWKVETVVGVTGDVVGKESDGVTKVFENSHGVVWEIWPSKSDVPHPSAGTNLALRGHARIDGEWSQAEPKDVGALTVHVPRGFVARIVEVHFGQSIIQRIPEEIGMYAFEGARRVRLNRDHAGEWIESLAADALLRRESPVATIELSRPVRTEFQVEFRNSARPPTERIVLIGEWSDESR